MSSETSQLPGLIKSHSDLRGLAEHLTSLPVIGVDTESNSLFAYQEQVCLIQFSTTQADYLVDPLAFDDLSPLAPVFSNPNVEKVFHAAEYDLICLRRDFDFNFSHLFDTMWAARILGREEIGLGSLLRVEFGVELDKRYQRADWGKRPLPQGMQEYAVLDTHYLIELRNRLLADLKAKNRLELAQEDFKRMETLYDRPLHDNNHSGCWERISGTRDLSPQQMAILKELCEYREGVARQRNRPVFKVLGDRTLVSIATACPVSENELESLPHVSSRQVRQHGKALLKAVRDGLNSPPLESQPSLRPDNGYLSRMDGLRSWRKHKAQKYGVESDIILPRDLMLVIVNRNPHTQQELESILDDVPWRKEHFGQELLALLQKL
jgi:ribonuclease D